MKRVRVLVAEDNSDAREMLITFLGMSYDVVGAKDGAEAWALLREQEFDALLTDISMPEMDGLELVEAILADFHFSKLYILVTTAHGHDNYAVGKLETLLGRKRVLQKPLDFSQLTMALEAATTLAAP